MKYNRAALVGVPGNLAENTETEHIQSSQQMLRRIGRKASPLELQWWSGPAMFRGESRK